MKVWTFLSAVCGIQPGSMDSVLRTRRIATSFFVVLATALLSSASQSAERPNGGWNPVVSPDGSCVAFFSQQVGEVQNLWVASADGRNPRQLTSKGARSYLWTSDSKWLYVYTWLQGKLRWCKISAADGQAFPVWDWLPADASEPTPSPSGSLLAYTMPARDYVDLWIASADGSEKRRITSEVICRRPTWSADDKQVAFEMLVSPVSGKEQVWVYNYEKKSLAHMKGQGSRLHGFSPDGKQLAYSLSMPPAGNLLCVCDVASGESHPAKKVHHTGEGVSWAPDGQSIAVTTAQSGRSKIELVKPNGTVIRRIGSEKLSARFPQFSPDGKVLFFEGQEKGRSFAAEVWAASLRNNNVERITSSYVSDWCAVGSPNGAYLAFLTTRKGTCEVWLSVKGAPAKRVCAADIDARLFWSRDSSKLLVLGPRRTSLVKMGAKVVAKPLSIKAVVPYASWSPDGKAILFSATQHGRASLMTYNFISQETKPLFSGEKYFLPPDLWGCWDPIGSRVAFTRGAEVWLASREGLNPKKLADLGQKEDLAVTDLRWNPSGDALLASVTRFVKDDAFWEMRLVSLRGEVKTLTSEPVQSDFEAQRFVYAGSPMWLSATEVVFPSARDGAVRLWKLNTATLRAAPLMESPASFAARGPKGRIHFTAPDGGGSAIFHSDARGVRGRVSPRN